MQGVRVENEIKMYSSGGAFSYEGEDPSKPMTELVSICSSEGFSCSDVSVVKHTDYYYSDTLGVFDRDKIILRYREMGMKAYLTMKMPSVVNGMGLSRREIEGEIFNDTRFDRWKSVQDYATEIYGDVEIRRTPSLKAEVIRAQCRVISKAKVYSFTFDKLVYSDPESGKRSRPCYELEFEILDEAIVDDPQMVRLLALLQEKYLFEEEKISKYARGMAFLRSIRS